jgi:oxaloacetate decarboxylase gamma subunit
MEHITDGFKLMAIGMGMVFCFLTLMVIIMNFLAKVLEPFAHVLEENQSSSPAPRKKAAPAAAGNNNDVVTAITAAVHKYRSEH